MNSENKVVNMFVKLGADLKSTVCDAVIMAGQTNCSVKFVFNGIITVVDKNTNIKEHIKRIEEGMEEQPW